MKHLLLTLVFSASLTAFSQVQVTTLPGHGNIFQQTESKPDTLRAYILVTMRRNGIARARMGFVVIAPGKRPVYLDCRKRALKRPQVGWGYEIVNSNKTEK